MAMSGKERVLSKRMVLEVSIVIATWRYCGLLLSSSTREWWPLLLRWALSAAATYFVLLNVGQFLLWLYVQATKDEP